MILKALIPQTFIYGSIHKNQHVLKLISNPSKQFTHANIIKRDMKLPQLVTSVATAFLQSPTSPTVVWLVVKISPTL